ncbi:MAG: aromatic ring-hydroxylating dioxygenase subunit alpha [Myxococcales bacterium]|nr:aromatic ring-hydroxylating dioxygenase subunit alpha [Myxococcales bacterium]
MTDPRYETPGLDIDALIARHRVGYSLERPFYVDPAIFEQEFEHIFSRQWQFTEHISRIPSKGDYFVFRIAGEEIIVVRGDGDTVYAHYNVCRHRGSRVCLEPEGQLEKFTCPYHAWTYQLDGSLAYARGMAKDFDPAEAGLRACQVRVFEGLIFINLTAEGKGRVPDFDAIARKVLPWIEQADLRHTKIIHTQSFRAPVNWKVALENFSECYHCPTGHPEWCKAQLHALRDAVGTPGAIAKFEKRNEQWQTRARKLGHKAGNIRGNVGLPDEENYYAQAYAAERMLIDDDAMKLYASLNTNGGIGSSKLLGSYNADDDGQVDWGIAPSGFAYTTCTSTFLIRYTPLAPLETETMLTWLVHEDAKEGIDYDIESVAWLGKTTLIQDQSIMTNAQAGLSSRSYTPGRYAQLEAGISEMHHDYLRELRYGRSLALAKG